LAKGRIEIQRYRIRIWYDLDPGQFQEVLEGAIEPPREKENNGWRQGRLNALLWKEICSPDKLSSLLVTHLIPAKKTVNHRAL